jgi:hypothetical protein
MAGTAVLVRKILRYLSAVLLGVTILAVFLPFTPKFPGSGLDPSWMFAMNQAVAQGLVFGTDVIFTYGPYASVFTAFYHPATDHLMIAGALLFGACYFLSLPLLAKGRNYCWVARIAFFLAGLMYSRDALLFSYPLLLARPALHCRIATSSGWICRGRPESRISRCSVPLDCCRSAPQWLVGTEATLSGRASLIWSGMPLCSNRTSAAFSAGMRSAGCRGAEVTSTSICSTL